MKSLSKRISKILQREFIEGTIYRVDLDRVDVAPLGSSGILRNLPLTGDRDKIKAGDSVKIITVAGERVALAGDVAISDLSGEMVEDASSVELVEQLAKIPQFVSSEGAGSSSGSTPTSTAVYVRAKRTTAQAIPTNGWYAISFSTYLNQTPSDLVMWSGAAPTQLICRLDGVYTITGHIQLVANANGYRRYAAIRINGATYNAQQNCLSHANAAAIMNPTCTVPLAVGDYVELIVFQDTGADLNSNGATDVNQNNQNTLEMVRIA